jgi:hypothetical protein
MQQHLHTAAIILLVPTCLAAGANQAAERAFRAYTADLETGLGKRHASPYMSEPVRLDRVNGGSWRVEGGLLHHWRASAFVPHASAKDMLALLRDYNHLATYYSPEVVSSYALTDDGWQATVAMRFKKQRLVTVVLDAEFQVESGLVDSTRGYSFSRSVHVWQVDQPETKHERRLAEGMDDGFLWRLNSYWRFQQMANGLFIECEAVSLTRSIPAGLSWLIAPIIETLPRDSLAFTMTATKDALAANLRRGGMDARSN